MEETFIQEGRNKKGETASKAKVMQIFQDSVFPSCVISIFKVKKYRYYMLSINEGFSDKDLKVDKMIDGATLTTKSTLYINNEVIFLQKPDKSVVDYTF